MKKILGFVEYIGTHYNGWQFQRDARVRSVSSVLLESVQFLYRRKDIEVLRIIGSSRTDRGVHALKNAFHLEFSVPSGELLPVEISLKAMNHYLLSNGHSIRVLSLQEVPSDFHSTKHAKGRHYIYKISTEPISVFERGCVLEECRIDRQRMIEGCRVMAELSDLRNFVKKPNEQDIQFTPVEITCEETGSRVNLHFKAKRFYWRQIRLMTGALVSFSRGKLDENDLRSLCSGGHSTKPSAVSPVGLYLAEVFYDNR